MLSDPKNDDKSRVARNNLDGPSATLNSIFLALKSQRDTIPNSLITFLLGSTTAISSVLVYKRYGKRIKNSDWITPKHLAKKRWIKGVVTSVGDADNFRLYHTPTIGFNWPLKFKQVPNQTKDLKNETIHIRIAGVDAPEGSHFGKPGQPYATEALNWLRSQILGKKVYCQLSRKDQYGRIVSPVHVAPRVLPGFIFNGKNVAAEMLKAGWGVTYEQAGAEYGKLGKDHYLELENEAKLLRRGMWKDGVGGETPQDYKRRHAENVVKPPSVSKLPAQANPKKKS